METTENIDDLQKNQAADESATPTEATKPAAQTEPKKKRSIGIHIFYWVLILGLAGGGVFLFKTYTTKKEKLEKCVVVKDSLSQERKQLLDSLTSVEAKYTKLRDENGQLNAEIETKLKEIKRLKGIVARENSTKKDLEAAKLAMASMEETLRGYIVKIDSLGQTNKQLNDANQQLNGEIEQAKKVDQEKSQQLEQLNAKVEKASVLKAANVITICLNKKGKPAVKASKVTKIATSLTLMENAVIDPGSKKIYIRIVRGDGVVLSQNQQNTFQYDNEQILYSEVKEIDYQNRDTNIDIYYASKEDELSKGTYNVQLFCDGKEIGKTSFFLK